MSHLFGKSTVGRRPFILKNKMILFYHFPKAALISTYTTKVLISHCFNIVTDGRKTQPTLFLVNLSPFSIAFPTNFSTNRSEFSTNFSVTHLHFLLPFLLLHPSFQLPFLFPCLHFLSPFYYFWDRSL